MHIAVDLVTTLKTPQALANALRTGELNAKMSAKEFVPHLIAPSDKAAWLEAVNALNALPEFPKLYQGNCSIEVEHTLSFKVPENPSPLINDVIVVDAARKSTRNAAVNNPLKDTGTFLFMWNHQHTSPFEQPALQFGVTVPEYTAAQMVRHRTAKLNKLSLRFEELPPDSIARMTVFDWRKQHEKKLQCSSGPLTGSSAMAAAETYHVATLNAMAAYKKLLNVGVSRELARSVLPMSFMTNMCWQQDLSNLIKFIKLRTDLHAQPEIQEVAWAMLMQLRAEHPLTFLCLVQHLYIKRVFNEAKESDDMKTLISLLPYINLC